MRQNFVRSLIFSFKIVAGMLTLDACGAEKKSVSLCGTSEKSVFSFMTKARKQVALCHGGSGATEYMVYRFGKPGKIELEFPQSRDSSFSKFLYWYYMRGGGPQNEPLDLNHLEFEKDGVKYEIYEETGPTDTIASVGIRVTLPKSKEPIEIKGVPSSRVGTLMDFRNDDRVLHGEP